MVSLLRKEPYFFLFLLLQVIFWMYARGIKPDMEVLPDPPSETAVLATSFGDTQFYFRLLAHRIQNAGDSFGRVTPLKDYDYEQLGEWFHLLDSLDPRSNHVVSLAAYYYSATQYTPDVAYIVDYLEQHADRDPVNKWWWYAQAIYNANHRLDDKEAALRIAYKLAAVENDAMPIWTRQMPALIHEDLGETEEALVIIRELLDNPEQLSAGELNFMYYFIKDRLGKAVEELNEKEAELLRNTEMYKQDTEAE